MASVKKAYLRTFSYLETVGASHADPRWQEEWRIHDDQSSASLITCLVGAYHCQDDQEAAVKVVEQIHVDSMELIESGIETVPVQLLACWSTFFLQQGGSHESEEAAAALFDSIGVLYAEAAIRGRALATALAFSKLAEEALSLHLTKSLTAIEAALSFLGWAERWNPSVLAHWHPKLELVARDTLVSQNVRAAAAYALTWTPQDITGIDGREVARFAFTEFHSLYSELELVCLLGRICDGDGAAINKFLPYIMRMVEDHVGSRAVLSELDALEERAVGLQVLGPIIRTLIIAGQDSDAITILAIWLGVSREDTRTSSLVTLLMSQDVGAILALDGRVQYVAKPQSITPLLKVIHKSLRHAILNLNDISWAPEQHDSRDSRVPDPLQASALMAALQEYLPVNEARDLLTSGEARTLLAIPAYPIPLQGWLLHKLGSTLPLTVSLRKPRPDRSLSRVLLWAEGSLYSEIERIEVVEIFTRAGIVVETPRAYTAAEFSKQYKSDKYDLIWVAGHGVYEPIAPYLSKLQVGVDEWVDATVLREVPDFAQRRLLVLNACEGGATFVGGGVLDSGLAASATSASQAVIAHLWPIRAWPDAVGFGILLSFLLANQPDDLLPGFRRTFFEAYQDCLEILSRGPNYVRSFITKMPRSKSILDDHLWHNDYQSYGRWPDTFVDWAGCIFYE